MVTIPLYQLSITDGTAMPGMLDLIYVFELISDGFDEGSCTEEDNGHDSE